MRRLGAGTAYTPAAPAHASPGPGGTVPSWVTVAQHGAARPACTLVVQRRACSLPGHGARAGGGLARERQLAWGNLKHLII